MAAAFPVEITDVPVGAAGKHLLRIPCERVRCFQAPGLGWFWGGLSCSGGGAWGTWRALQDDSGFGEATQACPLRTISAFCFRLCFYRDEALESLSSSLPFSSQPLTSSVFIVRRSRVSLVQTAPWSPEQNQRPVRSGQTPPPGNRHRPKQTTCWCLLLSGPWGHFAYLDTLIRFPLITLETIGYPTKPCPSPAVTVIQTARPVGDFSLSLGKR